MEHPPPRELLTFLKPYDEMEPCQEYIYDAYNAVALGYGPTDRLKDGICHIAVYAKHVNLGFNQGALLSDPEGLLQGSGKRIRHITLQTLSDLKLPEIRRYLRRAQGQAHYRVGGGTGRKAVVSVVKGVSPKKRRPSRKTAETDNHGVQPTAERRGA